MNLRGLARHRSALATTISGALVAALIATVAVVSSGYTAERFDLGDGAVWVSNSARHVVGRANTVIQELNTVVPTGDSPVDVVQQGSTVLVVDQGEGSLGILDPATAEITKSVPMPPEPAVFLSGDRAVVSSAGNVWSVPVDGLDGFDATSRPALSLGALSVSTMDPDGRFFSFAPTTGLVSVVAPDQSVSTSEVDAGTGDDSFQISSVGGTWAVLNQTSRHLILPGHDVDLSSTVTGTPVLQQPRSGGDRMLIAHAGGLLSVGISNGDVREVVTGRNGRPAAPATVGSCSFAAWSDGAAWRSCGSTEGDGSVSALDGIQGDAQLTLRANGDSVVLNDTTHGATWAVQHGNQLIDNWAELMDTEQNQQQVEHNTGDTPPDVEKSQVAPVATDDEFGARPGRANTLPVLLNDYDANGDALVISDLHPSGDTDATLTSVANNQQVRLTLPETAAGSLTFDYTISDGRGGSDVATVTVAVRSDAENSPPAQVRSSRASVKAGGRVTSHVLGDFVDPDGDPVYLARATAVAPSTVGFTPDGAVVFTAPDEGATGTASRVGLEVSDGRAEGSGSLTVTIQPAGSVPIIPEPFVVLATAGDEVTVSPLGHVRGGSGLLRLSGVPAKPDATITPDFTGGTFRFRSDVVGTHYLDYAVTDGQLSATGRVRIDVAPPQDENQPPVTVPHTLFLRGQHPGLADVLATDFDPAGGVLLVTGVTSAPAGLRVEILEQRMLRVTATHPLDDGPVTIGYRVSNGLADATGSVTVIPIPEPARKQAPVATADTVSVRAGDAIDIPVLDNDEHPDGDPLTLHPTLSTGLEPGAGLLFPSGNVLRYLAPSQPGNFTAVYRVDAPDGQFASAAVHIAVREADALSNTAPVPKPITARVLAGQSVTIPIPLSGIDPDGDSVQLLGQETNPEKGAVTSAGADSITYQAGEYSAGTDSFTYVVVDALGAKATGIVRVGISPRQGGARNPIANEDEATARPGSSVSVQVLANDSDPDGSALTVTGVTPIVDGATATTDGEVVVVTAPALPGRYGFIYDIQNERGGTSSAFLTVVVAEDAPLSRPEAHDTVLSLSDIIGRDHVDVDVLDHVFFADGSPNDLRLAVLPGYPADVTAAHDIRVQIGQRSQIIPFSVTHPDDPAIVAYAFIWVPGFADALPQLRKGMPPLTVQSEATLTIDINDYVVAVGRKNVRLSDPDSVKATHGDGARLAVDADTLRFTSAETYYGPASISFDVTDGTSAADPDGRRATIVLPIDVTPRKNQPPTFDGAVLDFEPGQSKVIDLSRLTTYPYPDDRGELAYTVLEPKPTGFSATLEGQQLTIQAAEPTPKGARQSLTVGVRDSINEGRAGRIEMRIVASTRPMAQPAADAAVAPRGKTTVVDVLANDNATNPFPDVPLTVIAVRGADTAALPEGVEITPSADKRRLAVTVAADAPPVDMALQYQVADATGDPDRYAWGSVNISVQDKPDPVSGLALTGFGNQTLSVGFSPGSDNNAAITGYEITLRDAATDAVVGTSTCEATACAVNTPGNGQAHAVRIQVAARNALGLSTVTTLAAPAWSDIVPAAPTGLTIAPLDGGLRLGWKPVTTGGGGSPVNRYAVTVGGTTLADVSAASCTRDACTKDVGNLANGVDVTVTVSARNDAYPALAEWNSAQASGHPYGPATAGAIQADGTDAAGTVTVSWDPFDGHGDPVTGYYVQRLTANTVPTGAQACSVTSPAPGTLNAPTAGGVVAEQARVDAANQSVTFTGLESEATDYYFLVWGYNRAGCAHTAVAHVLMRPAPGPVTAVEGAMKTQGQTFDYYVTGITPSFDHYQIRAIGSQEVKPLGTIAPRKTLGLPFGEAAHFELQGCTAWDACGPWSDAAAPEPSLSFTVSDLTYDAITGIFSWTNGPSNGKLTAKYTCFADAAPTRTGSAGDNGKVCVIPGAPTSGPVHLVVEINTHKYSYDVHANNESEPK
ncbi:Ig-like domain-containing protein [Cryobacterium tepidiphilum]|uniref:Tandem-95 repeat protein n=1 Tax=Cryobacterium tepidiphilum TaxID=2486026 RepID=A0A3M8LFT8_9MICO|nr:Ig-like domain-containing protein [Cryobacterium tepidiphilum]RNE63672.1 tandem-95 repeat protein [Cryobacterium tepidiphilum]